MIAPGQVPPGSGKNGLTYTIGVQPDQRMQVKVGDVSTYFIGNSQKQRTDMGAPAKPLPDGILFRTYLGNVDDPALAWKPILISYEVGAGIVYLESWDSKFGPDVTKTFYSERSNTRVEDFGNSLVEEAKALPGYIYRGIGYVLGTMGDAIIWTKDKIVEVVSG